MTGVFCGQRLFRRVMAEPGPAPNHTSLQPRSDSHRGWGGEGREGEGGQRLPFPGQRSNSSPRLAWRCDKAHFPLRCFFPILPLLPIMCHMLHTLARVCVPSVCVCAGAAEHCLHKLKERSEETKSRTRRTQRSFARGSVEPETTKCTS